MTEISDTASSTDVVCAQLSLDECANYDQCELVSGSPIITNSSGEECLDSSVQEDKACVDYGCSAEPSLTVAHPPEDEQCWLFPSGCLPDGWTTCSDMPSECE